MVKKRRNRGISVKWLNWINPHVQRFGMNLPLIERDLEEKKKKKIIWLDFNLLINYFSGLNDMW